ncbi:MAG TPA: alpha/beta hydrolase [Candidatus Omnitrophica bacterium]|nr:alpha/beta hydrolase [Candidatus Omnitrophota bacterium]
MMTDFKPVKLACQVQGTGAPVVLVHAFPLSKDMWQGQAAEFARNHQVITLDLPGFGKSPLQASPSIAAAAQSVALLLDELKIAGPVFIGGLSMGGYVVLEFFRQFPTRVRALGLFSTRAGADSDDQKKKRHEVADKVRREGMPVLADSMTAKLVGETTERSSPLLVEQIRKMILAGSPAGAADALLAMASRADLLTLLKTICVPVLILAGKEDKVIPVSEAEMMQKGILNSELHVFEQGGHLLNLEQPQQFNAALERFLKK